MSSDARSIPLRVVLGYNGSDMIQIYHLNKQYPAGSLVFQDAFFSAPSASFVVLYGGNRSGKSTLLKMMCGEESPTSGLVLVDGRRITELDPDGRRDHLKEVGLVFPDLGLLWERTVEENLLLPLRLREEFRSDAHRRALSFLDKVGLKGKEGKKPADLSFGEQRAVVFLRALVAKPRLILADEPFQGLDAPMIGTFMDILSELQKEGATVVLGTQDPEPMARYERTHPGMKIVWGRLAEQRIHPAEAPPC